ncbi:MAG: cytochrome C biogenesis protein [Candidatus Nephrothrix sp. EaCA]|nr:MAG: cytochrome C biogenesis protein [Candidatus Nephrothrix sp. EaCA]
MKISFLIAIGVIIAAIAVIVTTAGDASAYLDFSGARALAQQGNEKQIHVVGELKKDAAGNIQGMETGADRVSFSFLLLDEQKKEERVYCLEPMPQDLIRSEKIVVIGRYENDKFLAKKILLKCPSKYENKEIKKSQ